jgi:hypothetical protein
VQGFQINKPHKLFFIKICFFILAMLSICEGKAEKASTFANLIPKVNGIVIQVFCKSQLGENTLKGATKSVRCQNYHKKLETYLFSTI